MNGGVSIIVPAMNEEGNIEGAIRDVITAATCLDLYEIIVVDDGSTDGTSQVVRDLIATLAEENPGSPSVVRLVCHPVNRGLRAAYETGLAEVRMQYVTWVPGDNEMALESIGKILAAIGKADLVVPYHGTPWLRPWFRRLLTWGSTTQMNVLFLKRLHYYQGPVVYPVALARSLPRTIPGFFCMAEMLLHALAAGYTYVQVPLTHQERAYGTSKAVGAGKIWDAQIAIIVFWWRIKVLGQVQALRIPGTGSLPGTSARPVADASQAQAA
jgi:hypothetical protein